MAAPSWLFPRIGSFWNSLPTKHNAHPKAAVTSGDAAESGLRQPGFHGGAFSLGFWGLGSIRIQSPRESRGATKILQGLEHP